LHFFQRTVQVWQRLSLAAASNYILQFLEQELHTARPIHITERNPVPPDEPGDGGWERLGGGHFRAAN